MIQSEINMLEYVKRVAKNTQAKDKTQKKKEEPKDHRI